MVRTIPILFVLLCLSVGSVHAQTEPHPAYVEDTKGLPFTVPADLTNLPEYALMITTKGPIEIRLYRERTPISVANFVHLVNKNFYEGVGFHRYIPDFVIQGGDPTGTGKGDPGWSLPQEIDSEIHHIRGTIGWARKPEKNNPERRSNGSQFYICLSPQQGLDGFYTAFGVVVRGMENVDRLRPGDKVLKIRFPRPDLVSGW